MRTMSRYKSVGKKDIILHRSCSYHIGRQWSDIFMHKLPNKMHIDIMDEKESTEWTWGDVIGKFDDFAVSTSCSRELV